MLPVVNQRWRPDKITQQRDVTADLRVGGHMFEKVYTQLRTTSTDDVSYFSKETLVLVNKYANRRPIYSHNTLVCEALFSIRTDASVKDCAAVAHKPDFHIV